MTPTRQISRWSPAHAYPDGEILIQIKRNVWDPALARSVKDRYPLTFPMIMFPIPGIHGFFFVQSVVLHLGSGADTGHFVILTREHLSKETCSRFDDSHLTRDVVLSEEDVRRPCSALLLHSADIGISNATSASSISLPLQSADPAFV